MADTQEWRLSKSPRTELDGRTIAILYGTETGNSEEIADELGQMAERLQFETVVMEMNNIPLKDVLWFSVVIFVLSTTGQGEMPKNGRKLWKSLLRKKLPPDSLNSVKFTLFGLGDSSYPKFNWAARKLHTRLLQLGATEFFKSGEGDERHDDGIDSIYLPWHQALKVALIAEFPRPGFLEPVPDDVQLPPKIILRLLPVMEDGDNVQAATSSFRSVLSSTSAIKSAALSHIDHPRSPKEQIDIDNARGLPAHSFVARANEAWEHSTGAKVDVLDKNNILRDHPEKYLLKRTPVDLDRPPDDLTTHPRTYIAHVIENRRVTPNDHWQDVRFLTIGLKQDQNEHRLPEIMPASTIIIYPKNYPTDVQALIDLMEWQELADHPLEWVPYVDRPSPADKSTNSLRLSFPLPTKIHAKKGSTLRFLLTHNLDITAVPKRSFIRDLVYYAGSQREKERLKELIRMGNAQEFYDYASRPRRTILELLADFRSVKIPFQVALDLFPAIRGREFSIANGGLSFKDMIGAEDHYDLGIEILAALVEYKTVMRKPRQGLCSRYLKTLPPGTAIRVDFKISESGPSITEESCQQPLIAIATGTGIAPIRNIFEERDYFSGAKTPVGPSILFFGCRNQAADYYFRDEWKYVPNCTVIPAFSRDDLPKDATGAAALDPYGNRSEEFNSMVGMMSDTSNSSVTALPTATKPAEMLVPDYDRGKNYVQHQIRRNAGLVAKLIREDALICLCGNSGRMPRSVREALLDVMVIGEIAEDRTQAEQLFAKLNFWQETW